MFLKQLTIKKNKVTDQTHILIHFLINPELVDKEVLNLTNGLFPLQPTSPFLIEV